MDAYHTVLLIRALFVAGAICALVIAGAILARRDRQQEYRWQGPQGTVTAERGHGSNASYRSVRYPDGRGRLPVNDSGHSELADARHAA